jgi:GNAT superfamily N-acetyltransferase
MADFSIRPLNTGDKDWVRQFIIEHWGADKVVAHGEIYYPHDLPGFVAISDEKPVGLITYHVETDNCEIVTLDSIQPALGIGTALIEVVKYVTRYFGCRRLWLITTNDNLHALRFYQKRGFVLVAVHRNALDLSRKLKPEIPQLGIDGVPLRDEIELEMMLDDNK